ncbi:protein kinase [uncultured Adlercreutzia sp.]|uniref:protein kinase domain-containing protein n=1 Tax=uncultured Adlercreutzia sp. TaxID=875803 RepID=UPI0026F3D831|nr:protein kinase [uncultured Adlercreutzia sp.]
MSTDGISREPRRPVAATLVDVAPTLVDLDATSPVLSGADIPFTGDGDVTFTLHTADIIGAGGQGTVVRATDERGRPFAAKIAWQPQAVRDRLARATIMGYLRGLVTGHPCGDTHYRVTHLMPIFAFGQITDCVPGLGETTYDVAVMPLCDDTLSHEGTFSFELLRDTVIPQAAEALRRLHEQGIVHRDVKPKNLYLLDGKVVLGDFGISSVLEAGRDTGATKIDRRTPGYSPHSSVVQRENDWYALGYTLWTLYNGGTHPHQALIDADDLSAVLAGERPVPFAAREPEHESLGQLIYGLTYAHAKGRLGYDDIQAWLADPAAFRYRDPLDSRAMAGPAGYQFEGEVYEDRVTLVTALAKKWKKAKRHLYIHGLEDYFRKVGETDLAVALNALTDHDPDTVPDRFGGNEDLGLSRALSLIDPTREVVFWKDEAIVAGPQAADEVFRRVTATPLGFYRTVADDDALRDVFGLLWVSGSPEVAKAALAWLRDHDDAPLAVRVDRTLAVLEAAASDKAPVREFAWRYGSAGWAAWMQRNLRLYQGRTPAGERLVRAVGAAAVDPSASLDARADALETLVAAAEACEAHCTASPHLRRAGIVRESETVVPATAAAYFSAELFGRPVPRGFIAELMEASRADEAAVKQTRTIYWGGRSWELAQDAKAALTDAAASIDGLADAEAKRAEIDGLSKPAFCLRLAATIAFVLFVCLFVPRLTFGCWRSGVVHAGDPLVTAATVLVSPTGLGADSVYPDALLDVSAIPTGTFTGLALIAFLAAASTIIAPRLASAVFALQGVRTKGRTRRRATALRKQATAIADGDGAAECWITGTEEGPIPVETDTTVFIEKTRARRHPRTADTRLTKALFWGGALVAAACLTLVTAPGLGYESWADIASEVPFDFLQSELSWGIAYCGLAAVSFAIVAIARRNHPTMVTLCLLAAACVLPYLAVALGFIAFVLLAIYFIFSIFRR